MKTFGEQMMEFYRKLVHPELPKGVEPLLPFREPATLSVMESFYEKYYNDSRPRTLLFGINPGRFGAGVTGIGFTDPVRLSQVCDISHYFDMRPETSSVFVYEMIDAFGGPEKFYSQFHFSSVCPIGFTKGGKNFNYYDTPQLLKATEPFILQSLTQQLKMPVNRSVSYSIGKGRNFKFLNKINSTENYFNRIETVPHPRWVMQYRFKQKQVFIDEYVRTLGEDLL